MGPQGIPDRGYLKRFVQNHKTAASDSYISFDITRGSELPIRGITVTTTAVAAS